MWNRPRWQLAVMSFAVASILAIAFLAVSYFTNNDLNSIMLSVEDQGRRGSANLTPQAVKIRRNGRQWTRALIDYLDDSGPRWEYPSFVGVMGLENKGKGNHDTNEVGSLSSFSNQVLLLLIPEVWPLLFDLPNNNHLANWWKEWHRMRSAHLRWDPHWHFWRLDWPAVVSNDCSLPSLSRATIGGYVWDALGHKENLRFDSDLDDLLETALSASSCAEAQRELYDFDWKTVEMEAHTVPLLLTRFPVELTSELAQGILKSNPSLLAVLLEHVNDLPALFGTYRRVGLQAVMQRPPDNILKAVIDCDVEVTSLLSLETRALIIRILTNVTHLPDCPNLKSLHGPRGEADTVRSTFRALQSLVRSQPWKWRKDHKRFTYRN